MNNNSNVLVHHGIKGQRWGVRRYQNEDGSLTAAGKRRQQIDEATEEYKKKKQAYNSSMREFIKSGVPTTKHFIKNYKDKQNKYGDAFADMVDARAKMKSAKYDDATKKAKAERRVYKKALSMAGQKWTHKNVQNYGVGARLEEKLKRDKGEAYVKSLKKSINNATIAKATIGTAVGVGMMALGAYRATKL